MADGSNQTDMPNRDPQPPKTVAGLENWRIATAAAGAVIGGAGVSGSLLDVIGSDLFLGVLGLSVVIIAVALRPSAGMRRAQLREAAARGDLRTARAVSLQAISATAGAVIGIVGVVASTADVLATDTAFAIFGTSIVLVILGLRPHNGVYQAERREAEARGELDKAFDSLSGTDDLLGLMRTNRKQMDAYDAQARRQGMSSHRASLAAMVVGLAFVGIGLTVALLADEPSTKYAAAIIVAVGTATGGYIAQTFIRVNTTAQDHVRFYFQQPLVQSYLLTAERIVAQMPEAARAKQYERLVETALEQAASAGSGSPVDARRQEPAIEPQPPTSEPQSEEG